MPVDGPGLQERTDAARFTVRAYETGDEAKVLGLFARSFPHAPRSIEHFRWKYLENPFGSRHVSLTFDGEGSLVGHYSGYPVPFVDDGREMLAHQIGDTMTEVGVRHIGRGPSSVLGRTALHFYDRFCDRRIAFNYGFNVANIQKFSLKFLRSERVESIAYRVAKPLPPLKRTERWLRGYQLEVVTRATPAFDAFFERVAPAYRFCVRRNAAYLQWRYLDCPDVPYVVVAVRKWRHLAGWVVFRLRDNRFTWGDALFDPEFGDAPEIALRHLVPPYVERIEGWFPARPLWFDRILRELGFENRPEPQDLSLMCVPFTVADAVNRMRDRLYYTWGDSDLF